jgi:single-strand DNA-binding protein
MRGVNKVMIIGTVGQDPTIFRNTSPMARLSVGTTYGSEKDGTQTEWHNIIVFQTGTGKMVDIVEQYVTKGSKVYVEGYLKTNKYTDKNGMQRKQTQIICQGLQVLTKSNHTPQIVGEEPNYNIADTQGDIPF